MVKKIDIFYDGHYMCSTNQFKTCKEAKEKYYLSLLPGIKELR